MNGIDYNDIVVFTEVVRQKGFAAAGRVLGLPGSSVSRRVARLEEQVGCPLLPRTTRHVGLTDAGRRFYEHTAKIAGLVDAGQRAIDRSQDDPTGTLRVTAPPDDGGIVWELLSGFSSAHPRVDLVVTHTLKKLDLIEHEVDLALRGGPPPDTDLYTAQLLFDSRILLAASPIYLALRGVPERVEELAEHDGVCMDAWAPNAIRRVRGDRSYVRVQMRNRVRSNSLETARKAALEGLGIAPLLLLTCQRDLDAGDLVEVLPGALPDSAPFWALTPLSEARSAAANALLEHVIAAAKRITNTVGG